MMNWLGECLMWLLAAYGLFALLQGAVELIRTRISGLHSGVKLVLLVKNAEEYIEYIIRNTTKRDYLSGVLSDRRMIIVDMNSTDRTLQLLERLKRDFSHIEVLTFSERNAVFGDMDNNTCNNTDDNNSIFSPTSK